MSGPLTPAGAHVTYRQQFRRCGKANCAGCAAGRPSHGPYWYAAWREGGRVHSRYIGKEAPPEAQDVTIRHAGVARVPQAVGAPLLVRTLGRFEVWRGDVLLPAAAWERRKVRALLTYLLSAPDQRVHREQAAESLWPEGTPEESARNLTLTVHRLRKVLDDSGGRGSTGAGRGYVRREGDLLWLAPAAGAPAGPQWLDAVAFEQAASAALAGGATEACRAALALYGGEYLPDDLYDEWTVGPRERLRALRLKVLLCLARGSKGAGLPAEAEACLHTVLAADPCHEEAARLLMDLLATLGRRAEAVRVYRVLEEALRRDLGLQPDPHIGALYRELLLNQASSGSAEMIDRTALAPVQPVLETGDRGVSAVPLVGRVQAMTALEAHLRHVLTAREGPGRLVGLEGSAGIGKSRLLAEFLHKARQQGALVLSGRAYHQEGQVPYGPLQEALQSYVSAQHSALLAAQAPYHAVLVRLLPVLATRLRGLPQPPPLEPRAERHRLFAALAGLLGDLGRRVPVVLALEDMHWADPTTLQALHYLQRTCRQERVLIVATYRGEQQAVGGELAGLWPDLRDGPQETVVALAPLDEATAAALVMALLAPEFVDPAVVALMTAKAAGNPLFVGELVRAAREAGRITLCDGCWKLGPDVEMAVADTGLRAWGATLPVSQRIQSVIQGRLERLGPEVGRLVRLCAVLNHRLAYPLLCLASETPENELLDALEVLVAAGLLNETEVGYAFHHPLIPEAVYQTIPSRRRVVLHRRAAEALLAWPGEDAPVSPAELAWHYGRSGAHEQAALFATAAGDQAAATATLEALGYYLAARAHLERLAAAPGLPVVLHDDALSLLDEKVGDLRLVLGEYASARADFTRARRGETQAARRARLWVKEGKACFRMGEYMAALVAYKQAEDEGANGEGLVPAYVRAATALGRADVYVGRAEFVAAMVAVEEALGLLETGPEDAEARLTQSQAYRMQGNIAWRRGALDQAEAHFRRSLALGDQRDVAAALMHLGILAQQRGDLVAAEEHYRQSLVLNEKRGEQEPMGVGWFNLGRVMMDRGEYAVAVEFHRRSLASMEAIDSKRGKALNWNHLGMLARLQGQLADAERYHRLCLPIFEHAQDHVNTVLCCSQLGLALAEQGDRKAACAWSRRARRLASRLDAPEAQSWALLGQAAVLLRGLTGATLRPGRLRMIKTLLAVGDMLATTYALQSTAWAVRFHRAEVALCQGRAGEIDTEDLHALASTRHLQDRAATLHLLGRVALARGAVAEAAVHLRSALTLQSRLGIALEAARARVALARALAATSMDHTAVECLLAEAARQFAASGAGFDLEEVRDQTRAWDVGADPS